MSKRLDFFVVMSHPAVVAANGARDGLTEARDRRVKSEGREMAEAPRDGDLLLMTTARRRRREVPTGGRRRRIVARGPSRRERPQFAVWVGGEKFAMG